MKYRAIFLASILLAAGAWAESEDPSYEPDRHAKPKPSAKTSKPKTSEKTSNVQPLPPEPAPRVEAQTPPARRVLLILNGRPVYEDDPDAAKILSEIEADKKKGGKTEAPRETYVPRENAAPSAPAVVRPATLPPASEAPSDDLIADKPGTHGAATHDESTLEEFPPPAGLVSSRTHTAYEQLHLLKKNVDTLTRCLDNRGKENARLVHASEETVKNISELAGLWPKRETYIEHCTVLKREALILNNELNQVPWKWAQVRWSYNTMMKDVENLRRYAKTLADAEPPPVPVLNKKGQIVAGKDGKPQYQDAPDLTVDPEAAKREARIRATQREIDAVRDFNDARDNQKKRVDVDLDGTKTGK